MPKKDPKKCDKCGKELIHREDDQPKAIAERLKIYKEKTLPLEQYYEKQGIMKSFVD